MKGKDIGSNLLDPSLLEGLTSEERSEALAAAAAAKRAEERAEQRALERAMQQRQKERQQQRATEVEQHGNRRMTANRSGDNSRTVNQKIVFVSKRKRQQNGATVDSKVNSESIVESSLTTTAVTPANTRPTQVSKKSPSPSAAAGMKMASSLAWTDKERQAVRKTYLGMSSMNDTTASTTSTSTSGNHLTMGAKVQALSSSNRKKKKGTTRTKKATFRFEWDNTDDTLDDHDPLYAGVVRLARPSGGPSHPSKKRKKKLLADGDDDEDAAFRYSHHGKDFYHRRIASSFHTKPLEKMTPRDWRIFRENYEIVVKGGRAPPPLRNFQEANLHSTLNDAIINVMQYKEPTPIQRQAIPIGLQRRDLIGIAETGSGKTCAFGLPLLQYLLQLPTTSLDRVPEDGPLALVVAPTRELALQIHGEFQKLLSRQTKLKTCAIVGGQNIQHQAQVLRQGVHVVVGTPGRMNDCIDMAYLVLNQCCYIVLDEADRMIDMGFAPQMESILDAMGGLLKSENEQEAYQQEEQDVTNLSKGLPRHRLTAMFSATMPLEVERIAKRYLRHPAVISIGDQDSGKNARIVQRVVYLKRPSQKESALRDLLSRRDVGREKTIVFVNEKKHADGVGRMVERMGRTCVVLHGGKSQEQREDNLKLFRQGGVVLVATDVAGRGLDIPDVAHVINFDLPTRSIDAYSHRIGRTGRAGKEGLATSLITDEDEGIMAPLKAYLESTGNEVPEKLARHPAANTNSKQGNVIY